MTNKKPERGEFIELKFDISYKQEISSKILYSFSNIKNHINKIEIK